MVTLSVADPGNQEEGPSHFWDTPTPDKCLDLGRGYDPGQKSPDTRNRGHRKEQCHPNGLFKFLDTDSDTDSGSDSKPETVHVAHTRSDSDSKPVPDP